MNTLLVIYLFSFIISYWAIKVIVKLDDTYYSSTILLASIVPFANTVIATLWILHYIKMFVLNIVSRVVAWYCIKVINKVLKRNKVKQRLNNNGELIDIN